MFIIVKKAKRIGKLSGNQIAPQQHKTLTKRITTRLSNQSIINTGTENATRIKD